MALSKALKYVENQATKFINNLDKSTHWQRPDANSLKQVLTNLNTIKMRVTQLTGNIQTSSYSHHASKMANLEKIDAKVDSLSQRASAKFKRSHQEVQLTREREDRHIADQAANAKARSERRQYVKEMINSGRGGELYNGGMVK